MPTRTKLSVLTELQDSSPLERYPLTKHMMMTWRRFELKRRFHLNSDRSRLQFILWYLIEHVPNVKSSFSLIPPQLLAELNKPALAWGPISTFMFAYWRDRHGHSSALNIQTEDGYLRFVVDYLRDVAPRHPILHQLVPLGALAEIQKPFFFDGVHHLSRGAASIWKQSSVYHQKYPNLSDWQHVEAFNFDLIVHDVAEHGCLYIMAPEAIRYWSSPVVTTDRRLSRFMFALAAMSPRFNNSGSDLDVLQHIDAVVNWFETAVVPRVPMFGQFAGSSGVPAAMSPVRKDRQASFFAVSGSTGVDIDLLLIGPFSAASGLGTGARRSLEALQAIGASFRAVDLLFDNPSASLEAVPEQIRYAGENPRMTLWHFNAEYLPDVFANYPEFINPNKNIGYFFWETEAMPRAHQLACDMVDEIWVPSKFVQDCYARHAEVDVVNVGTAVNLPKLDKPFQRAHFGLSDDFVYMFSFDGHSVIHRKNPAAVARAFRKAFPNGDEPVQLILKTQNLLDAHWGGLFGRNEELFELCDGDRRISLVNKTLTLKELYSLKAAVNCYVSLHRSEGFGYGPAEAMALGKPVVMTDYSANLEFGTPENCLLVSNRLIPVLDMEYLYWEPEMVWADVDVADAARCMRLVYDDPQLAADLGAKAKQTIERDFGIQAMGAKYRRRLDKLLKA